MRIGVVGQTARDVVTLSGEPAQERPGGAPLYAARALRASGVTPVLVTKGLPIDDALVLPADATFVSILDHSAGALRQRIGAVGEPFSPEEAEELILPALAGCDWVVLGGQTAGDFPAETIAVLAGAGLSLLLDAQGPLRGQRTGPVRLEPFPPEAVRGVRALKLNEDEALAATGGLEPERLLDLGAPEVLVTRGYTGALVVTEGGTTAVPAGPVRFADPTGAGDSWAALYAAARAGGREPADAARHAGEWVERIYGGAATAVTTGSGPNG